MQALRSLFANMSVGTRIVSLFLCNLLAIIIIAVIATFSFHDIGLETQQIATQDLPLTNKITAIAVNNTEQSIGLERALRYAEMGDMYKRDYFNAKEKFIENARQTKDETVSTISFLEDALQKTTNEAAIKEFSKMQESLESIDKNHKILSKDAKEIFSLIESNRLHSARNLISSIESSNQEISLAVSAVLHKIENFSLESIKVITARNADATQQIIAITIAAAIIGMLFTYIIKCSIAWNDTAANKAAIENSTRVMSAINAVTSNVMVADADNIITYMNPALEAMLKEAEKEIQETLNTFRVDEIIGGSVDRFHKNPAHQQGMLKNLTETYETTINVGKLVFNLVATPITGDDGERLGTVVEWTNATEILIAESLATRIQTSLDCVTSNVMIADEHNDIQYMNPALVTMLSEAEAKIQEHLPNFKVSEILGGSVDRFHKNPAHQQGMLKNLSETYATTINVGSLLFDLVATPILDDAGARLGSVVEWQNVTEVRIAESLATRIQTSLDCVTSNVMIADEKNDIQYMNPALVAMLSEAEAKIQEHLPNFKVDEILGGSVDRFHKNPAHQQGLLKNLSSTYETTIKVGELVFDLVATPIMAEDDTRLGTVVEWQNVTLSRVEEARASRIQTSLDCVTSNVMLADENNIVIYMNDAVANMLQNAEADIRKALPDFRVDTIIGTSIDKFHKNPAHQRSMLENLNSTYSTVIKIAGRSFALIANPVMSKSGDRLGTVVEWNDVTSELKVESEVANVVHAATEGDFTKRLTLDDKDGFMLNLSEGINKIGEISHIGLSEVTSVIQELYDGTLTMKIEGDYKGSFDDIKQALNGTIQRLNTMVTTIISTAGNVNSASSEISAGSNDLSERTEKQASTLEETAASMEELTGAVRQNTDNASDASKLAVSSKGVAQKGGEISTQAIEAMANIETSSQKIADIIGVIDEIAFQTNLLALNAAVEAARAGEAGKGFAVVASEVRSLAGRSASASKEIKDLISDSAKQVKFGSELVNEAGQTLTEIVGSINEVADLMSGIASASEEQSSGIDEINTAVAGMDEMTQQNAALVEENTAAARSLVEQAVELQEMMQFFTVDEENDDFGVKKKKPNANPRPAARSHKASKPAAGKKPAPAVKSPNTGSDPEHYSDGWEEF